MQYKTKCIPASIITGVNAKDYFYRGITEEEADTAGKNISKLIDYEAKQGWSLHSVEQIETRIKRKKTIIELLFGWIPVLGAIICRDINETKVGSLYPCYFVTFVRED